MFSAGGAWVVVGGLGLLLGAWGCCWGPGVGGEVSSCWGLGLEERSEVVGAWGWRRGVKLLGPGVGVEESS